MNYCFCCGKWREIIAYARCRECFDNWFNQRRESTCETHIPR